LITATAKALFDKSLWRNTVTDMREIWKINAV